MAWMVASLPLIVTTLGEDRMRALLFVTKAFSVVAKKALFFITPNVIAEGPPVPKATPVPAFPGKDGPSFVVGSVGSKPVVWTRLFDSSSVNVPVKSVRPSFVLVFQYSHCTP